jgi:ABC-type nitrate/sulfonate/bicarbonate transport system substrate-binding protein
VRLVPIGGRTVDHRRAGHPARVLAGMTALLAGLLTVAGCQAGSSSTATPTFTDADNVVRVAQTPGVGDAPLFLAFQQGLFRKAGLQVRITNYGSTRDELVALQQGKADVAFGDYADMFYAQAKGGKNGLKLVIVAGGYDALANTMEVLALPPGQHQPAILSPKDLVGKTIGTASAGVMPSNVAGMPYSLDTVATQSVLQNNSIKPSSISWRPLPPGAPQQQLLQDLATHQVNAILATEPTIFEAESQLGAVPVLDSCTGATSNLPLDGYFSTRTFATAHHAKLAAFRDVLLRAQALANNQSAPVRNTLEGSEGMSVQDASLLTIGQYPTTVSVSDLQRVISLMFSFNAIPSQPSVKAMLFH